MATLKHICYTYIINNAYSGKISKEHKTDKIWFKWRTWIALACAIIVAACLPACACDSTHAHTHKEMPWALSKRSRKNTNNIIYI